MTWLRDLLKSKYADAAILVLVLLLGFGLLFAAYSGQRSTTVEVGSFGVGPYLSNFYADEPDVTYRYRWTKDRSVVLFTGAGSAQPVQVRITAQAPPANVFSGTITTTLSLNGLVLQPSIITVSKQLKTYIFNAQPSPPGPPYALTISSTTFRPAGDPRTLGIKLVSATLVQSTGGLNAPPLDLLVWWLIFLTGVVLVLTPIRLVLRLAISVVLLLLTSILLFHNVLFAGAYLPTLATIVALVGIAVWQRRRLPRWPFVTIMAGNRPRLATWIMLAVMLIFTGISLWAIPQVLWVGHADYAENANIARNFVEGRGLTVDYVAQFYKSYPGITHPAETWPLLQPLIIAPFFAIFGPTTWASKLPNLFILLGLAWGVFLLASRLWDARAGLFAGLLTLFHPYFFNTVLYPISDLAFTAIFFFLAWLVWYAVTDDRSRTIDDGTPPDVAATDPEPSAPASRSSVIRSPSSIVLALAVGALAALLIWSKPSGAPLLVGLALWAIIIWWRGPRRAKVRLPMRSLALLAGAFVLVLLPLVLRNLFALGTLYFSTEGLDAWTLRFWPYINWENIYKVYVGAADYPHPRWIVGGKYGYQNLIDAVSINFRWVWDRGVMAGITNSDFIIAPIPLAGALLGLLALPKRVTSLFVAVLFSLLLYSLFVLLYWHFEGRYFQVAIPWLYMLLAWGVVWLWDRLRSLLPFGKSALLAWAFPLVALVGFLLPALDQMHNHLVYDTRPTSFTVAMDWLNQNSTPTDVVMTRDPWELNWYTGHKAVMIPFDDLATIKQVAKEYGVTMLQIGGPGDSADNFDDCPASPDASRFPTGSRPALGKLYCGYNIPGFTRVYQNNDLFIYRLTQ